MNVVLPLLVLACLLFFLSGVLLGYFIGLREGKEIIKSKSETEEDAALHHS